MIIDLDTRHEILKIYVSVLICFITKTFSVLKLLFFLNGPYEKDINITKLILLICFMVKRYLLNNDLKAHAMPICYSDIQQSIKNIAFIYPRFICLFKVYSALNTFY